MSEPQSAHIRTGKRVMKLLELHHRHQRELEQERRRLAEKTLGEVASIVGDDAARGRERGGVDEWPAMAAAAKLARGLPRKLQRAIASKLPPGLEEEFTAALSSFDAIPALPPRIVQEVIRKARNRDLAVALLGARDEHFHAITANMSERAARMLREDMESLLASGELGTRDVHDARRQLSSVIRGVVDAS